MLIDFPYPRGFTPKDFTEGDPVKVSPTLILDTAYGTYDGKTYGQRVFAWEFGSAEPATEVPLELVTNGRGTLWAGDQGVWLIGWHTEGGKTRRVWQQVGTYVPYKPPQAVVVPPHEHSGIVVVK